jgi:hypothetical protein
MSLSDEQKLIVETFIKGSNCIVNAVPGSGKTHVLMAIHETLKNKNVKSLHVTYNKSLKDEIKSKINNAKIKNVEVHNFHTLSNYMYNVSTCKNDTEIVSCLKCNIVKADLNFDFIMIDEAQDMTDIFCHVIRIFIKNNKKDIRMILVGDRHQELYGFMHADFRYLTYGNLIYDDIISGPWVNLELTYTYRCPSYICNFINDILLNETKRIKSNIEVQSQVQIRPCSAFNIIQVINKLIMELKYETKDIYIISNCVNIQSESVNTYSKCRFSMGKEIRELQAWLMQNNYKYKMSLESERNLNGYHDEQGIIITTPHQTKGLERKVVLILNFNDFHIKSNRIELYNTMYVSMTRAKEQLYLFVEPHEFIFDLNGKVTGFKLKHDILSQADYMYAYAHIPVNNKLESNYCNLNHDSISDKKTKTKTNKKNVTGLIKFLPYSTKVSLVDKCKYESLSEPVFINIGDFNLISHIIIGYALVDYYLYKIHGSYIDIIKERALNIRNYRNISDFNVTSENLICEILRLDHNHLCRCININHINSNFIEEKEYPNGFIKRSLKQSYLNKCVNDPYFKIINTIIKKDSNGDTISSNVYNKKGCIMTILYDYEKEISEIQDPLLAILNYSLMCTMVQENNYSFYQNRKTLVNEIYDTLKPISDSIEKLSTIIGFDSSVKRLEYGLTVGHAFNSFTESNNNKIILFEHFIKSIMKNNLTGKIVNDNDDTLLRGIADCISICDLTKVINVYEFKCIKGTLHLEHMLQVSLYMYMLQMDHRYESYEINGFIYNILSNEHIKITNTKDELKDIYNILISDREYNISDADFIINSKKDFY